MSLSEKHNIAKTKGISKRNVPRFAVRRPEEIEISLGNLFSALQEVPKVDIIKKDIATKILLALKESNVFKTNHAGLIQLLKLLGIIDEENVPTSLLEFIWKKVSIESYIEKAQLSKTPIKPIKAPTDGISDRPIEIYVGNLNYNTTEETLLKLFKQIGDVLSLKIPKDFVTGRGRGFGFVKMSNRYDASRAIEELNYKLVDGRTIFLNWGR